MAIRGVEAYRRILVPVSEARTCDEAMAVGCRLAADHGATVTVLTALEVPAELPLAAQMPVEENAARALLAEARAIAELYGVSSETEIVRARSAGEAIVEAARAHETEIVVVGARRRARRSQQSQVFGRTVSFVLMNAPCRVMVAAPPK